MAVREEGVAPPRRGRVQDTVGTFVRSEGALLFGALTTALFYAFPGVLVADLAVDLRTILLFVWLFATMLWCAFGVVRHADSLAEILGEPYGTLILTLSVIVIQVSVISAIMLLGENEPTLARDTMFAVLMIVLNALVGLTLLLGGLRYREQHYNLQGAKSFLAVLVPLAVLALVLPEFTTERPGFTPPQALFFTGLTVGLYAVFLMIQTVRHRNQFIQPGVPADLPYDPLAPDETSHHHGHHEIRSVPFHAVLLLATMLPVVLLSETMAAFVEYGIETIHAPVTLGGLIIATLVLAPEGFGALRAARANRLQRSVNILLGAALATVCLTVPAVLILGLVIEREVWLGLERVQMILLLVTLAVSSLTFTGGRTNILQGAIHLVLFFAFIVLIFHP